MQLNTSNKTQTNQNTIFIQYLRRRKRALSLIIVGIVLLNGIGYYYYLHRLKQMDAQVVLLHSNISSLQRKLQQTVKQGTELAAKNKQKLSKKQHKLLQFTIPHWLFQHTKIDTIRLVGIMCFDKHYYAFVQIANRHTLQRVTKHMLLGQEQAVITKITLQDIVLKSRGGSVDTITF